MEYNAKQVLGIPMGGNAAVFIANIYLFMKELKFMRQLVEAILEIQGEHPTASDLIDKLYDMLYSFQLTGRFIDDLLSLTNSWL